MPYLERSGQPRLHYTIDDYTDPWRNAPYLILQHGNGRSGRFWYSWIPYLARWYKVVRPDMRGLGLSSREFDLAGELTVANLVGDLAAIIGALGAQPVHYCGESMGGILGLVLAAEHPELIRTLSLVATPAFINEKVKETYSRGHGSRVEAMQKMGIHAWIDATNRTTRFPPETDGGLLDWYATEFAKGNAEVQTTMAQLVQSASAQSHLPRVTAPVLGLYPSSGQITTREQEEMLLKSLKNFTLVHMPTAYHMVHQIFPAACAQHVLHFCAQHHGVSVHER